MANRAASHELPPTLPTGHPDLKRERYNSAQAAIYLDVPVDVIYRAVAKRAIGHRRASGSRGGRVRFSQADLDAYREAQRVEPTGVTQPVPGINGVASRRQGRVSELSQVMPKHSDRVFA